ncbi:hypothetical protein BKA61DRAFT_742433 [Leptodontidium sp. MPI-SDFR-AT-0119]|nr:hypothetical protein BKA61DRAFT_742433 [Leptodontidium sp. MPI-SDFR-AT-0119]
MLAMPPTIKIILPLYILITQVAASCYNLDGAFEPSAQLCSSTDGNDCCNTGDFCTSVSGLCLNVGGNNFMTNFACSNQDWSGCTKYCEQRNNSGIMLCNAGGNDGKSQTYCCTNFQTDCCADPNALSSMPVFSTVFRPGARDATTSSTKTTSPKTVSTSPTSSGSGKGNAGVTTTTPDGATTPSSSASPSKSNTSTTLAVGLGVGISFSLALIACLVYIIWQRRKTAALKASGSEQAKGGPQMTYENGADAWKAPPYQSRLGLDAGQSGNIPELSSGQMGSQRGRV